MRPLALFLTTAMTTAATFAADLHTFVDEYRADVGALSRRYPMRDSETRRARFDRLYADWEKRITAIDVKTLDNAGKAERFLFLNHLSSERRQVPIERDRSAKVRALVPFAQRIIDLEENRMDMETIQPALAAAELDSLADTIDADRKKLESSNPAKEYGYGASQLVRELRQGADRWFRFYNAYDPMFTWWCDAPKKNLDRVLEAYEKTLSDKTGGSEIPGLAVGREALVADLDSELIPYTPEELIAFGEREYAWCLAEMKKASNELGYGDDWKKALEHVKKLYVEPGKQTELVKKLALEAIDFVESRKLVSVPPLAKETWRMEMMSPEAQRVSPFFLGGESIIVSYPTDTMTHDEKMMSMRGNNPYFSRATVQHELIPGHHLQQFMESRYNTHRQLFRTPFWTEGWALYWEMVLWDKGFPRTPEERVGMLFWRMHRCVRIVFSLKFHLGELSTKECVDMLVDRVGHERANAEGEVRRSFNGSYPPLYQLAYMIGGLQFRAMRRELVDSKKMSEMQFHDAILKENNIPVAVLRSILKGESVGDRMPVWKFEG